MDDEAETGSPQAPQKRLPSGSALEQLGQALNAAIPEKTQLACGEAHGGRYVLPRRPVKARPLRAARLQAPLDSGPSGAGIGLGIASLPVSFEHAEATAGLPLLHRDPFDRLPVAQARLEGLTLVTRDPSIRSYPGVAFLPS
jgi:hypothetical protein